MIAPAGYLGDFAAGDVVSFMFHTPDVTTNWVPFSLGSGAVKVYHSNNTTETATGVTLTADFDGVVGLNHVNITTVSDGTFFAAGRTFHVVLSAGDVNGNFRAGTALATFSIANRLISADVTKWNGTAVATPATAGYPAVTHKVGTGTGEINLASGKAPATIAAGDIANGAITAAAIATGAIDADALASDAVDEILDEVVEGTLTMRQVLRLAIAFVSGKATGGGSTPVVFRDSTDAKNRISMTVDADGNRSAVTTDVT